MRDIKKEIKEYIKKKEPNGNDGMATFKNQSKNSLVCLNSTVNMTEIGMMDLWTDN